MASGATTAQAVWTGAGFTRDRLGRPRRAQRQLHHHDPVDRRRLRRPLHQRRGGEPTMNTFIRGSGAASSRPGPRRVRADHPALPAPARRDLRSGPSRVRLQHPDQRRPRGRPYRDRQSVRAQHHQEGEGLRRRSSSSATQASRSTSTRSTPTAHPTLPPSAPCVAVGCLAVVSFEATYFPITPFISNILFKNGVTFEATSVLSVEYSCPLTPTDGVAALNCPKQP